MIQDVEPHLFENMQNVQKGLPNHSLLFNPYIKYNENVEFGIGGQEGQIIMPKHYGMEILIFIESFCLPGQSVWTFIGRNFGFSTEILIKSHGFSAICFLIVKKKLYVSFRTCKKQWLNRKSDKGVHNTLKIPFSHLLKKIPRVASLEDLCIKEVALHSKSIVKLDIPCMLKDKLRNLISTVKRFPHPQLAATGYFKKWRLLLN
jgi:hypothetical protein